MDNCFNQYMDNFNAVQGLSDKEKNWAKKDDCHPDVVGIQKYADFFANVISKNKINNDVDNYIIDY